MYMFHYGLMLRIMIIPSTHGFIFCAGATVRAKVAKALDMKASSRSLKRKCAVSSL